MTGREPYYTPPPGSIPTLDVPTLEGVARVHLIGIGGAGMRNLAQAAPGARRRRERVGSEGLQRHWRSSVSSAPMSPSATIRRRLGAPDAVIVSSAIGTRNVELVEAHRRGIPVWARAQALAALASGKRSIAIAGTHGKTTTTSMVAVVLEEAGLEPSFLIGGPERERQRGPVRGRGRVRLRGR